MSETQADIDALLAEADALAREAAAATAGPQARVATLTAPSGDQEDTARILRLEVPIIVRLAERTMPLSDIVNLNTGSIIEFEKPADGELDLMINNQCIGTGHAVKVGENFGLRVTEIGSVRSRIEALGG